MYSFFYSLLFTVLVLSQTGCRKILKSVGKEAAKEGLKEVAKNVDKRAKQKSTQISDSQIKKKAQEANSKLKSYREQCAKYKKVFDTVSTRQHYKQASYEFKLQYNHFYTWLKKQSFHSYSPSSKFASQYNNWYMKFERYHKSYTNSVKKSQTYRYRELNK